MPGPERMLAGGHAYYCFCAKEQLEQGRALAQAERRPPKYPGTCRRLSPDESARKKAAGQPAALRFKVPEAGSTTIADAVFGPVEFAHSEIEDFVLLRSDGIPTYHLSVVTDDLDSQVYLLTFSRTITCTDLNNFLHLVRCAIPNTLNNVH